MHSETLENNSDTTSDSRQIYNCDAIFFWGLLSELEFLESPRSSYGPPAVSNLLTRMIGRWTLAGAADIDFTS